MTAILVLIRSRDWTFVQQILCMWVFSQLDTRAHGNWLVMMSTLMCYFWIAEIENTFTAICFTWLKMEWFQLCKYFLVLFQLFSSLPPWRCICLRRAWHGRKHCWIPPSKPSSISQTWTTGPLLSPDLDLSLKRKNQLYTFWSWFCQVDNSKNN